MTNESRTCRDCHINIDNLPQYRLDCDECIKKRIESMRRASELSREQKIGLLKDWGAEWGVIAKVSGELDYIDEQNNLVYIKTKYGTLQFHLSEVEAQPPPAPG